MSAERQPKPQIVTLRRPTRHHALLVAIDGRMLGLDASGDLGLFDEAGDGVIWDRTDAGRQARGNRQGLRDGHR